MKNNAKRPHLLQVATMTDRQARLKALAARAGRIKQPEQEEQDDEVGDNGDNVSAKPALTFRNYAPRDASLDAANKRAAAVAAADGDTAGVVNDDDDDDSSRPIAKRSRTVGTTTNPAAAAAADDDDDDDEPAPSSRSALQDALREARREVKVNGTTKAVGISTTAATASTNTIDVTALAPQKIDADLRKGIADRLAKLERRTQKSIVEMLKERLEMEAAREAEEGDGGGDESDLD